MADCGELVSVRGGLMRVQLGEKDRIAFVAEALELLAKQAAPSFIVRFCLECAERLEVEVEAPGFIVDERQLAPTQLGRLGLRAEHAVARDLDPELGRAGDGAPRDHGVRPLAVAARVQALDNTAVDPERCLAERRPQQLDTPTAPPLGDRRPHAEPVGRPEGIESLAELGRAVLEFSRFLPRDAVDRAADDELVDLAAFRPHRGEQVVCDLEETRAGILAMPNQATLSASLATAPGNLSMSFRRCGPSRGNETDRRRQLG